MTNKEALHKSYQILSPYSDKQRWEFNNNLVHLRYIAKYIPKSASLLDVGCGIGILDIALILLGYAVKGVDKYLFEENNNFTIQDIGGLRRIWQSHNLEIMSKDILCDELNEKYDAIISIATIEHQKGIKRFLSKMLGALNPCGLLYIATPNASHLLNRARFLFGLSPMSGHFKDWFDKGENFEGHWREYTLAELKQMFGWLDIAILGAYNTQSMRPCFKLVSLRSWYVAAFRLLAHLLTGTGDTNIIIGLLRIRKN